MTFTHYSGRPIDALQHVQYRQIHSVKPEGFWISVDGEEDWKEWCQSNNLRTEDLKHAYAVELDGESNILWLKKPTDVDEFEKRYCSEPSTDGFISPLINWPEVASQYDGIVISPYYWERRWGRGSIWYYSLDCASGCIWNLDAIARITPKSFVSDERDTILEAAEL
ncbi:MAG TPA: hypothetical protein VJQ59_16960 [Candidatus Sulfotelmatobacter sp.]|nr:hypothetical protein [Candidatus Sulfotelmatobacter sp.]